MLGKGGRNEIGRIAIFKGETTVSNDALSHQKSRSTVLEISLLSNLDPEAINSRNLSVPSIV
jgi:hypothetical protein